MISQTSGDIADVGPIDQGADIVLEDIYISVEAGRKLAIYSEAVRRRRAIGHEAAQYQVRAKDAIRSIAYTMSEDRDCAAPAEIPAATGW